MNKPIRSLRFSTSSPSGAGPLQRPLGLLGRALAIAAGGAILLAGLFVSALVFSVLLVVGAVAGGWFWWKTRDLRKDLRERMEQMQRSRGMGVDGASPAAGPGGPSRPGAPGNVIDGDYIQETERGR